HDAGLQSGSISQQLSQVTVVCGLKLVLDDCGMARLDLFAVEVDGEWSHLLLASGEFYLKAERFIELIYVLSEPGCKRRCFMSPDFASIKPANTPQLRRVNAWRHNHAS